MSNPGISFFERHLTWWVLLCIAIGIGVGAAGGNAIRQIAGWEIAHVNYPCRHPDLVDDLPDDGLHRFSIPARLAPAYPGLSLTVTVNWLIKPFSMAFFAWDLLTISTGLDHPGGGRPVHCRGHPGAAALHSHGVRVVLPVQGRPQLYPGPGVGQ